jgi:hypothetical protein
VKGADALKAESPAMAFSSGVRRCICCRCAPEIQTHDGARLDIYISLVCRIIVLEIRRLPLPALVMRSMVRLYTRIVDGSLIALLIALSFTVVLRVGFHAS